MHEYEVVPRVSFAGIAFGTDRRTVRKRVQQQFGMRAKEFMKGMGGNSSDAYADFHAHYDDKDRLEAVEIFWDAIVRVGGATVFPAGDIADLARAVPGLVKDADGWTSVDASVGVYAPDGEIEGILFGRAGYYR